MSEIKKKIYVNNQSSILNVLYMVIAHLSAFGLGSPLAAVFITRVLDVSSPARTGRGTRGD